MSVLLYAGEIFVVLMYLCRLKSVQMQRLQEDLSSLLLPLLTPQKALWLPSGFPGCKFGDIYKRFRLSLTCANSPGNHSVSQSSFSSPCQPLSGGFDSGFIYVPAGVDSGFPEWNITITDDSKRKHPSLIDSILASVNRRHAAIWFYCKQLSPGPHCISGMVG
jgi:hypothetical protein